MAVEKAKGSLIYKFLIVVLSVVLVVSILYPKILKDDELHNRELARYRMEEIEKAQLQYQRYNYHYNDTLSVVFDFIKTDPMLEAWIDSVIIGGLDSIITQLNMIKSRQEQVLSLIPSAVDSVMIDSLETLQGRSKTEALNLAGYIELVHDKMKNLPNMPLARLVTAFKIVDRKQFTLDMEKVVNLVKGEKDLPEATKAAYDVIDNLTSVTSIFEEVRADVPEYKGPSLDELQYCPTTGKPFQIVHVDTSVIKYLNIYSPIDSEDIAAVNSDFVKSTIGDLRLENHGKIESGEKSWEIR
jgi:hypothetical protein